MFTFMIVYVLVAVNMYMPIYIVCHVCRYCSNPDFNPDVIKSASTACEGLCRWVRAMEVYERVAKVVAPKKIALAEAEAELAVQMAKLNEKRAELNAVLSKRSSYLRMLSS